MRNANDILRKRIEENLAHGDQAWRITEFNITGWSLVSLKYDNLNVANQSPVALQTSEFTNDTTETDTQTFSVDKETTDSFTWSITEGIEAGTEFNVNVPLVGGAKTHIKLNLSSTQQQTVSRSRKWIYSAAIPVPPRSSVSVVFSVLEGTVNTPFTATLQAHGTVKIAWLSKESKDWWQHCGGDIDEMIRDGYCLSDRRFWEVAASGKFSGIDATRYVVHSKQGDGHRIQIDASPTIPAGALPARTAPGKSVSA